MQYAGYAVMLYGTAPYISRSNPVLADMVELLSNLVYAEEIKRRPGWVVRSLLR